jgi:predicted translin family RNA/ssDNA-binding protein
MRISPRERAKAAREAAMPEVRRLVKKHGYPAITYCLGQMRDKAKAEKKLKEAREAVAKLERAMK